MKGGDITSHKQRASTCPSWKLDDHPPQDMTSLTQAFIAKWPSLASQLLCHLKTTVLLSRPAIWTLIWMDCMRNMPGWKVRSVHQKWKVATVRNDIWNCSPKQMYHLWISGRSAPRYFLHPMQQCTHRTCLFNDDNCMEKWEESSWCGQCQGWAASVCQFHLSLHRDVQEVHWKQKTLGCSQERTEVLQIDNQLFWWAH